MPILTVRIDETLRSEAADVLDELGLDIPTAVRMYLKAVVREKGLPIATKIDAASSECEVPASAPIAESVPVPADAPVIDYGTRDGRKAVAALFIDEILAVPAGKLTRWRDLEANLTLRCGVEVTRPQSVRWPKTTADGTVIPYWRIVGERGAVRGDKMIEADVQKEKLKAEGHTFVDAGHGIFCGIKVDGWREKLV